MDEMLNGIVANPSESIPVELKRWLDLSDRRHLAKIIKACAALYNSNGGYLVIGVNNNGSFQSDGVPPSWRSDFDPEILQQIVANQVSPPFEVAVTHVQSGAIRCVAIKVPAGVVSPVCMRSNFNDRDGNVLLAQHEVYCRSLSSNGKYSSTRPGADDWERITRIFLDNRESNIARFLSRNFTSERLVELARQLARLYPVNELHDFDPNARARANLESIDLELADEPGLEADVSQLIVSADSGDGGVNDVLASQSVVLPAGSLTARNCLAGGYMQFEAALAQCPEQPPPHGSWEIAAVFDGIADARVASDTFLNLVITANPVYTYVPFWTAGRGASSNLGRPYVFDNGWQSLINAPPRALNFWRADPRGLFYLYRALEDDISMSPEQPAPMTKLDFALQVIRIADAIAVLTAISAVIPMRVRPQTMELIFRWRRLAGRELSSWSNIRRVLPTGKIAFQDNFETSIVVPTNATQAGIGGYVYEVTRQLFSIFDGMQFDPSTIDYIVRGVFERRI